MLTKIISSLGFEFWGESLVSIGGKDYALNEMTEQQQDFVLATVDAHALNAVYVGQATFAPEERVGRFEDVFPEQAEQMGRGRGPRGRGTGAGG